MTRTQSDRLAKAIGHSIAYHTSDQPFWQVVNVDVAHDVGEATADVCEEICAEIHEPFDIDRFLNRVTDSYDATKQRRLEERSSQGFYQGGGLRP